VSEADLLPLPLGETLLLLTCVRVNFIRFNVILIKFMFILSRVADHLGEQRTAGRDMISAIVTDQSARYPILSWQ